MSRRWFVGLSSGSSLNGVDVALIETEGTGLDLRLRLKHFHQHSFSRDVREFLWRMVNSGQADLRQLAVLHRVLGETYAFAADHAIETAKVPRTYFYAVGLSDHMLWHETEGRFPSTLCLGMVSVLAEKLGLTVASDFRSRDVVSGGQGFPLTSQVDHLLFQSPTEQRVLVHLGGMASVLWLPRGGGLRDLVGFQTTPCTVLLDGFMRLLTGGREVCDQGGKHAVQGCCIEPLVERWLAHPLLQKKPPKSMNRAEFGEVFLEQAVQQAKQLGRNLHDVLCSATHFVVRAVVQAVQRFLPAVPDRILLSGGGVRNGFLWRLIEQHVSPTPVEKIDAYGIPAEARKATAFAGLAALTLDGVPTNVPSVTGAVGARILGSLTPGNSGNWARCLAWMHAQTAPWNRAAA
ncbi:MAG: anhydro-N-acetylmuramic acid kinase [Gemmataceae bacterium]|nr:anhydro-N-acetylmuramic acid kinase [Gemmataceae bacterium]MCI0739233.1 anhydro-N-acetylmuramic acid kinase [Gemmataceae bacterium]